MDLRVVRGRIEEYAIALGRLPDPSVPDAEWIEEAHPELSASVIGQRFPVFASDTPDAPTLASVRILAADDPGLGAVIGAIGAGFANSDTVRTQDVLDRPDRMADGSLVVAGAYDDHGNPVGGGLAIVVDKTAELSGMAVIPAARGTGLPIALIRARVAALRQRGVDTVFMTATSTGAVAAAEAAGMRHVGTALFPDATPVAVRRLRPEDWQAFRAIRLRALKDSADAFGATYDDSRAQPDESWQDRLAQDHPTYVVLNRGRPVAMGGGFAPEEPKDTAMIWGMWTEPASRGRGYSRLLLDEIIDWARRLGRTPHLHVTEGNDVARGSYLRYGFAPTGRRLPLRPGSPLRIEELVLANRQISGDLTSDSSPSP